MLCDDLIEKRLKLENIIEKDFDLKKKIMMLTENMVKLVMEL